MMHLNALVIDDSGIMRKLVMRSLTQTYLAEFEFSQAADGVEALEQFQPEITDIIFVDWNMPNMSGIDFARKIKSTQKRKVPIIMITTERTVGKLEEALDGAVDCFISKPFTTAMLQRKLVPIFRRLIDAQKESGGFFSKLKSKRA